MTKGKKIVVASILIVLGCIIAYVIWHQVPIHTHVELNMYDDNGNPSVMQMDLAIRRSLSPNKSPSLQGTIEFEGKHYESLSSYDGSPNRFFDIKQLQKGGTYIELTQNSLLLFYIQFSSDYSSIELLSMHQAENGEGKTWRNYVQNESID